MWLYKSSGRLNPTNPNPPETRQMADITLPCGHSNYDMCSCGEGPPEEIALIDAIDRYASAVRENAGYMPAIATRLRIIADEMADKYPDDTNGGHRIESH